MVLLASLNGKLSEETNSLSAYTLPELLPISFNHPEMDSDLRVDLWQRINDTNFTGIHSAKYIGAMLGMKAYGKESTAKTAIRQSIRVSYSTQIEEAKEHLDLIIAESEHESHFLNALISLFGVIKKQSDLDKEDLLGNLQDYVFAHTLGFDSVANGYIAKFTSETSEAIEETEISAN